MVRVVQIKRARMVVEHFIETLPERKVYVCRVHIDLLLTPPT